MTTQQPHETENDVAHFTLANGLRVVHQRTPGTCMAVVTLLYDVGARDESATHTGMAHLFEHLMFGGSVNIPDYDAPLQAAGGQSNAWTSPDFTCFYDILPTHNIDTALWLESDRMLSLAFSDKALEVQRSVVVEEFKQECLNRPYGDADHHLYAMCYPGHPYGIPVIGRDFHDIEKTTQEDVRQWFYAHYAPNNAVLSIVADLPTHVVMEKVERWFGTIPSRPVTPRQIPAPAPQTAAQQKVLTGNVPSTTLTLAYRMAPYGHPDYIPADLITDILSNGKASRFYRNLLMGTGLFSEIDACITGSEHPGLLLVMARLNGNGEEAERTALEAIEKELGKLATEAPSEAELRRCVNRVASDRLFGNMSPIQLGQSLATARIHNEELDGIIPRYRAVTPEDIRRVAADLFRPCRRNLLIYRPKG